MLTFEGYSLPIHSFKMIVLHVSEIWTKSYGRNYTKFKTFWQKIHTWVVNNRNKFSRLNLYKGERFKNTQFLDIKCFSKPCDTFQYLSRDSSHPNACFSGMVKGEAIRYIRNSSSETEYEQKIDFFISKLLTRGYKKSDVLNCFADISYKRRNIYLEDVPKMKNEIPLVFCTHRFPQRSNAQIKKALIKNWHYISENKKLSKIFPCPPILALRRTQNLGERLIRAKITQTQNPHTSLTPNMQNIDDSSPQIGSCPMSYVSYTKRFVRSVRRNLNALLNLYFMTCLLLNSQAPE